MGVDPDEGLVTDVMLGTMIVFGADIVFFVGSRGPSASFRQPRSPVSPR